MKSPKTYVRDSGLLHALLGIADMDSLLGHPVVGASWEGMVIENLIAAAPPGTQAYFYRTAAGAEIDLVLNLAGIWNMVWPETGHGGVHTFAMLTQDAGPAVSQVHHRQPVILHASDAETWLQHDAPRESLDAIMQGSDNVDLTARRISPALLKQPESSESILEWEG